MLLGAQLYDIESLRDLAWRLWDPMGLRPLRKYVDDEYDAYLLQAAGLALRKHSVANIQEFLACSCEGMGARPDAVANLRLARAIVSLVRVARASKPVRRRARQGFRRACPAHPA